jgi:glucosyl-3-phosphoglycerate synthase
MADFHQSGCVATLHRLDTGNLDRLEHELEAFAAQRPIALVLPCRFSEFSRPAIHQILEELRHIRYIDSIVVSLAQATSAQLGEARAVLSVLPQRVSIVWQDGPAVMHLYHVLRDHGLDPGPDGKGRECWIAYGYLLAERRCAVIASHDCDILTYGRELLARLCYPVLHPQLGYDFAKGYYARVNGTLNGRVTRLFVTPLLRAMQTIVGRAPLLAYLDSFRYPLSGEFAMKTDLARVARLPANWGLEVGMLAEVYRNCALPAVCQTEVCANYDHEHQALSAGDPGKGLMRMSVEIAQTLLRALNAEGIPLGDAVLDALLVRYTRMAEDTIPGYEADALINGLAFDRDAEEQMVDAFGAGLQIACRRHRENALSVPLMPSWSRVMVAIPGFLGLLQKAVDHDAAVTAAA